jgi:hypothetical protein
MNNKPYSSDDKKILGAFTAAAGEIADTRRIGMLDGHPVNLVTAINCPRTGVNSFSTIGLSVMPIGYLSGSVYLGSELVGMAEAGFDRYIDVLSACVDDILHLKARLFPGAVYKDAFKNVFPDITVKHLIFDTPRGWDKDLLTIDLGKRQAAWIMAIPVTDAELRLYSDSDSGELQERFDEQNINLSDLNRESVA